MEWLTPKTISAWTGMPPLADVGYEVMGRRRVEDPRQFPEASEMDDGAERDACAIGGSASVAQADVVELRPQCQMGQNSDINAATCAIGEVGRGAAAGARGQMSGAHEELKKRSEFSWIVQVDARAEEKRVGIKGCAAGRGVVAAYVTDNTQIGDGVVGDRTADAVLTESVGAAQAEVGVAGGGVDGRLGARRYSKDGQRQAKQEKAFHRHGSFRAQKRI